MIISHSRRFVMLAPWKTASTTTHQRLASYNDSPYDRFYYYNPHLQRIVHQHLTHADFLGLPEAKLGYLTASFVRNPYDRVYSGFLQLQRDLEEQPRSQYPAPWIRTVVMRQLAENFAQLAQAGFEFEAWWALVEEHQVYVSGRNSSFPLHPAYFWTGTPGGQGVDFVGKVESYEADFEAFCAQAGVPPVQDKANANVSGDLPPPGQVRYAARMSAYARSKIETLFREDFERFGYETFKG